MGNIIDITDILLFKKAVRILEKLNINYDYFKLRERLDICKEIVILYEDDFKITEIKNSLEKRI